MTLGFGDPARRKALEDEVIGWQLYQLHIDKYHAMFWFENGWCLLNVAWRFGFISADRRLHIIFDSGDRLIVFDQPHERSCWFMHFDSAQSPTPQPGKLIWSLNDLEPEDVGRIGFLALLWQIL
jgi:hypothetical protein